jgi:hypothetical protein
MKKILVLIIFILTNSSYALDIDEKLTLRFLKVSNSKKTILINRGAEDGLVVGDHAKFFITSGVIARGVVEKASPSRSIWALYRVVDAEEIVDGKVLNLKIASPVKLSADPSKSMKDEDSLEGNDSISIPSADTDVAEDKIPAEMLNANDKSELDEMGLEDTNKPIVSKVKPKDKKNKKEISHNEAPAYAEENQLKNWEVWGTLYLNSLSGTSEDGTTAATTSYTASSTDISAGIERYFTDTDSFLRNLSVDVFLHKRSLETGSTIKISTDWFEYGAGLNYHFYNNASSINKIIGFGGASLGAGSSSFKEIVVTNGTSSENLVKGSNTFYSLGVGAKYVLSNGFGLKAILDYYSSNESYDFGNDRY